MLKAQKRNPHTTGKRVAGLKPSNDMEWKHQQDLERLQKLRPIDDDFMRCLFKDNLPLAQLVLRIITGKPDLVITDCQTQKDMKRLGGARSVCLDAYGTDSAGKKHDLEIQRADKGAEPHQARYHASVMDVENLDGGQKFEMLPDTYTIFITEKDFYGQGEPVYIIERMILTMGKPFEDGGAYSLCKRRISGRFRHRKADARFQLHKRRRYEL